MSQLPSFGSFFRLQNREKREGKDQNKETALVGRLLMQGGLQLLT